MEFRTPIALEKPPFAFDFSDHILSIGSCFSENIGRLLSDLKFDILLNPCGITYNSGSIRTCIKTLEAGKSLSGSQLIFNGEVYAHPDFHGQFNSAEMSTALQKMNDAIGAGHSFLQNTTKIILTLGTAFVFRSRSTGAIVNNCHKQPASEFTREMLTADQIRDHVVEVIRLLRNQTRNKLEVIMTVSPVRHLRNGLVPDRLSKSHCLIAAHQVCEGLDDVYYFPAYEMLVDDLRDYRFFNDDMAHPSAAAIRYVWDHFANIFFDHDTLMIIQKVKKINNQMAHKALHKDSEKHRVFLQNLMDEILELEIAHPFLDFSVEKKKLKNSL